MNTQKERRIAEEYQKRFSIKTPSLDQIVGNLSGRQPAESCLGQEHGCGVGHHHFDEPTRGIDVATKYDIYVLMNDLVAQGKAILMVSSEMPELIGMCDRIVVLSERSQVAVVEQKDFSQEHILDLASGNK